MYWLPYINYKLSDRPPMYWLGKFHQPVKTSNNGTVCCPNAQYEFGKTLSNNICIAIYRYSGYELGMQLSGYHDSFCWYTIKKQLEFSHTSCTCVISITDWKMKGFTNIIISIDYKKTKRCYEYYNVSGTCYVLNGRSAY